MPSFRAKQNKSQRSIFRKNDAAIKLNGIPSYPPFQTINILEDLRLPVYMTSCCRVMNADGILQKMAKVAWDIREVRSQHSQYVDVLLRV